MALIIDGYNLLHVTGIFGRGPAASTFERSRAALLDFLSARLDDAERKATIVVFDGAEAPPGLPQRIERAGLDVRFARRDQSADELIEQLIDANTAPRRLTVVSSDHQVQRAARRRRAKAIDSEQWFRELLERGGTASREAAAPDLQPGDVAFWLRQFGAAEEEPPPPKAARDDPHNLFPPGYGDDLE